MDGTRLLSHLNAFQQWHMKLAFITPRWFFPLGSVFVFSIQNNSLTFRFHFSTIVCGFFYVKIVFFLAFVFLIAFDINLLHRRSYGGCMAAMCMCGAWCTAACGYVSLNCIVSTSVEATIEERPNQKLRRQKKNEPFNSKSVFEEDREIDIRLLPCFFRAWFFVNSTIPFFGFVLAKYVCFFFSSIHSKWKHGR